MTLDRSVRRTALAAALLATSVFAVGVARADVPDLVWESLKERRIVVEKNDGARITGKLIGLSPAAVVVMKDDGEPITVERSGVKSVRGETEPTLPPSASPSSPPPPAPALPSAEAPPAPAPSTPDPYERFGFVGGLVRPIFCMSRCGSPIFTAGAEIGYRFIAAAVRGGVAGDRGVIAGDLRMFWDFRPIPKLVITPLAEISPSGQVGGRQPEFDLSLRFGARVGYALTPRFVIWGELTTFELHIIDTNGRTENTDIYGRYAPAIGAQYRF